MDTEDMKDIEPVELESGIKLEWEYIPDLELEKRKYEETNIHRLES